MTTPTPSVRLSIVDTRAGTAAHVHAARTDDFGEDLPPNYRLVTWPEQTTPQIAGFLFILVASVTQEIVTVGVLSRAQELGVYCRLRGSALWRTCQIHENSCTNLLAIKHKYKHIDPGLPLNAPISTRVQLISQSSARTNPSHQIGEISPAKVEIDSGACSSRLAAVLFSENGRCFTRKRGRLLWGNCLCEYLCFVGV